MPFAIEPIVNPTLDIPAPIISAPQAGDRTSGVTPSFQEHLDRVGRSNDGPRANSDASSNAAADERAEAQARRNDEAGDRAEAERRDEAAANENRPTDSTASKADDSKSKPTESDPKVEGKKKPGEHHQKDEKKQGDDAATVAVVAVVATQEATAQDEVTLTADEGVPEADAKGTEISLPTDGKKKGQAKDLPIGPNLGKQAKDGEEAKDAATGFGKDEQAATALAEAQAKADAAVKDGTASAEEALAVPLVSELHSTKFASTDGKKPKTRAEFTAEVNGGESEVDQAGAAVIEATAVKPATEPGAASADQVIGPEKGTAKPNEISGPNADPSFAAQLQGAVEAAAVATSATTLSGGVATTTDTTAATPVATTTAAADTTKTGTTKTSDVTLTAAEALRSNSAKEASTNRVAGEEVRQADGLSTADRARLVQRVARAVRTAQDRGGELQIRLSPPELGQLRLQIQMTDGTLSARIEAESPHAKQVITENLGQLRERLAEQNVRVERIDVELMNTGNGGSPNLPDRRNDFTHDGTPTPRGFTTTTRHASAGDAASAEVAGSNAAASAGPGRLNVVI